LNWKDEADKLYLKYQSEPNKYALIASKLMEMGLFGGKEYGTVRETVRGYFRWNRKEQTVPNEPIVRVAKPPKIEVVENQEPSVVSVNWKGNKIVRFGLVSDTHINSKYTQLTYLNQMYDIFRSEGITHVYNVGDIDDGEQMRPGHQYECYTQGADDHVAEIVRVYPHIDGITTHFITGNHDASLMKHVGYNIGYTIAEKRPDMDYLGPDCAIVMLTPNCSMELRHPWDGGSYALSYRPQKIIDSMSGGEKPNILAIGHYHKGFYMPYRNVHCVLGGCFQAQTPFLRGKTIQVAMGGWVIEALVDEEGFIQRFTPSFYQFYVGLKDDWKNWRE